MVLKMEMEFWRLKIKFLKAISRMISCMVFSKSLIKKDLFIQFKNMFMIKERIMLRNLTS